MTRLGNEKYAILFIELKQKLNATFKRGSFLN